jgi:ABC-type Fe3+-hydroxamate transport system substrate-binding protein
MRVVSLLPSASEALCLLGGESLLVGRSHECDFPRSILDRPILTEQATDFEEAGGSGAIDAIVTDSAHAGQSLYRLNADLLASLQPDLILTQDLCSVCSIDLESVRAVARAIEPEPRVLSLNPQTFEDVLDDLVRIGRAVGMEEESERALLLLRNRFFSASDHVNAYTQPVRTLFMEWIDPVFVGGHWVPQLIERAGGLPVLNETEPMEGAGAGAGGQMAHRVSGPSRRVSIEEVVEAAPEAVVICPCGLDLETTKREAASLDELGWFRELPAVHAGRVAIVDGNQMFARPGPRLVDAYEWLVGWLNGVPSLIPSGFPWSEWGSG